VQNELHKFVKIYFDFNNTLQYNTKITALGPYQRLRMFQFYLAGETQLAGFISEK